MIRIICDACKGDVGVDHERIDDQLDAGDSTLEFHRYGDPMVKYRGDLCVTCYAKLKTTLMGLVATYHFKKELVND